MFGSSSIFWNKVAAQDQELQVSYNSECVFKKYTFKI